MPQTGPRLTSELHVMAMPDQLQRWRQAAQADGRDLSNWVRWVLDREAEKQTTNKEERP